MVITKQTTLLGPFEFNEIKQCLKNYGYAYETLPVLNLSKFPQRYKIDFLVAEDLMHPIMKFVDRGRKGVAIRLKSVSSGRKAVMTFFSASNLQPYGLVDGYIDKVLFWSMQAFHVKNSLCCAYKNYYCDDCPFYDRCKKTLGTFFFTYDKYVELIDESTQLYILDVSEIVASYAMINFDIQIF